MASLFRPNKRRKVVPRIAHEDGDFDTKNSRAHGPGGMLDIASGKDHFSESEHDGTHSLASLLRRRHAASTFKSQKSIDESHDAVVQSSAEGQLQPRPQDAMAGVSRFVAPTGQLTSVDDKHMMAYIDSQLATSHTPRDPSTSGLSLNDDPPPTTKQATNAADSEVSANRYHGREHDIEEVEIVRQFPAMTKDPKSNGVGSYQQNMKSRKGTLEQTRKTQATSTTQSALPPSLREETAPIRIGRYGQLLPPREPRPPRRQNKYACTDADIARDRLVEDIFSEHKFSSAAMSMPDGQSAGLAGLQAAHAPGNDRDADARLAEDFKREFLADAQDRNDRRRPTPIPSSAGLGEVQKGPKLGGSRSQRAAMQKAEDAKTKQ